MADRIVTVQDPDTGEKRDISVPAYFIGDNGDVKDKHQFDLNRMSDKAFAEAKNPPGVHVGKIIPDRPEDIPASATAYIKPDLGQRSSYVKQLPDATGESDPLSGHPVATGLEQFIRAAQAIADRRNVAPTRLGGKDPNTGQSIPGEEAPASSPLWRAAGDIAYGTGNILTPLVAAAAQRNPIGFGRAALKAGAGTFAGGQLADLGSYLFNADPETQEGAHKAGEGLGTIAFGSPKIQSGVARAGSAMAPTAAKAGLARLMSGPVAGYLGKLIGLEHPGVIGGVVEAAANAPAAVRGFTVGAEGKPAIDPRLSGVYTGQNAPEALSRIGSSAPPPGPDTRPFFGPPTQPPARPVPGQPPNLNIPTTNTGQGGFLGGTLPGAGAPPAVTGQYAPTMNPLGTMPEMRPIYGPENHPLYGPPTPPPLQGPVNKPIYGPENMPLYGPENQPVYGPENYPLHGPEDHPVYGPERKPKTTPKPKPKPKPKAKPAEPAKKEPEPKKEEPTSDVAASDEPVDPVEEKKFDKPVKFDDTKSNEKVMQGPLRRDPSEIRVKSEEEVVPKTKTVLELQKEAGPKRDTAAFFREAREARKGGSKPKPAEEKEPSIKNSPGERGSFSLRDIPEKTEGSYDATTGKHIVTKEHVQDHANNTGMSYEDAAKAFDPSEFVIKDKEGMRRALFARGVEHGMKRPDIKDNAAAYFNKKSLSELTEKQIHEYWEALGQPSLWKAPKE